jgi:hypothetical protein
MNLHVTVFVFFAVLYGNLSAFSETLVVPGTANPWLAGATNGETANGDTFPEEAPVLFANLLAGNALVFNATGSAGYESGAESGPDGVPNYVVSDPPENGIAGQNLSLANALMGVFLDDSQPDPDNTPDAYDFSSQGLDYLTISPGLKQPFFIGDGLTSDSVQQAVVIPTGATRLFLGITDGSGWYNNTGSFTVTVTTTNLPILTIATTGTNAVLSWRSALTGYTLHSTTNLTNPNWSAVTNVPATVGLFNQVTNAIQPGSCFYQLQP